MRLPKLRDQTSRHELERLQGSHEEIIRLATMGMSVSDIATEMECTEKKINYTLQGNLGTARLRELQDAADIEAIDISQNIHEAAEKAIKLMDEVVSGSNEEASIKERLDTAKQLLHMDGFAPVTKQIIDIKTSNVERIGLEQIRDRAQKLRLLKPPETVEASFVEFKDEAGDLPRGLN